MHQPDIQSGARKYSLNPLSANPTKWSNTLKQLIELLGHRT